MREEFLDNLILSNLNSLDIYDASIEILDKLKFLNKDSHEYKFKEIANQVVVETKDYYYKLYIDYGYYGKYLLEIRKKLSDIYQSYGIHWKLLYNHRNGRVITIEQREKLKICNYGEMTCKELLQNWKSTVDLLREKLEFTNILSQVKNKSNVSEFNKVKDMLLLRGCLIKPDDFAYAPNGKVILLDDADFFISFIDENGKTISKKSFDLDIMTTCGLMNLSSNKGNWEKRVLGEFDLSKQFFIFDKECRIEIADQFVPNDIDTMNRELSIFATGKPSNSMYKNQYYENYTKKNSIFVKDSAKKSLK